MTAYQAHALSGREAPAGCRPVLDWLAPLLGRVITDRPFGEDIERLLHASGGLTAGKFARDLGG
jgi:hypothetical protein